MFLKVFFMPTMTKEQQEKISKLQLLEQSRQTLNVQKQNFQLQLMELESAIKELKSTRESYRIVGNVMIKKEPDELLKELEEEKQRLELRIKSLDKQEETIKNKMKSLQEEIMKSS